MKVIELLNKIANGEEVPYKVKYYDVIYRFDFFAENSKMYVRDEIGLKLYLFEVYDNLNDEVEVIEEDKNDNFTGMRVYQDGKEIYAIDDSGNFTCKDDEKDKTIETINWKSCADNLNDVNDNIDDLVNKINEIIDKINKGE